MLLSDGPLAYSMQKIDSFEAITLFCRQEWLTKALISAHLLRLVLFISEEGQKKLRKNGAFSI